MQKLITTPTSRQQQKFPTCLPVLTLLLLLLLPAASTIAGKEVAIPLGKTYGGPKCAVTVADFAVQVPGAPQKIGDGLREMLQTALFESNYFTIVDRQDTKGISAEQLLAKSFMANADAILAQGGQMVPAEVLVYGTITNLEGGGHGLRLKMPWLPLSLGGTHYQAKVTIELRAVDAASGKVIAAAQSTSTATSGKGSFGTTFTGIDLPVELEMFANTPLELCIRDSIYRCVIKLCQTIPARYFTH